MNNQKSTRSTRDWGKLTRPLQVKVTESMYRALFAAAGEDNRSLSEYLRSLISRDPTVKIWLSRLEDEKPSVELSKVASDEKRVWSDERMEWSDQADQWPHCATCGGSMPDGKACSTCEPEGGTADDSSTEDVT